MFGIILRFADVRDADIEIEDRQEKGTRREKRRKRQDRNFNNF